MVQHPTEVIMSAPPVLSLVERLPPAVSNRRAVELLESFLEDARAGRIISVAVAAVSEARIAVTASSSDDDSLLLLGAVTRLKDRISASMDAREQLEDELGA
jgi:hypothetical protein